MDSLAYSPSRTSRTSRTSDTSRSILKRAQTSSTQPDSTELSMWSKRKKRVNFVGVHEDIAAQRFQPSIVLDTEANKNNFDSVSRSLKLKDEVMNLEFCAYLRKESRMNSSILLGIRTIIVLSNVIAAKHIDDEQTKELCVQIILLCGPSCFLSLIVLALSYKKLFFAELILSIELLGFMVMFIFIHMSDIGDGMTS